MLKYNNEENEEQAIIKCKNVVSRYLFHSVFLGTELIWIFQKEVSNKLNRHFLKQL